MSKKRGRAAKARNYVFTLFGEKGRDEGRPVMLDELEKPSWVTYCVFQLERCPETKRLHFQGYLECRGTQLYTRIQREWEQLARARFDVRHGTQAQAIEYCEKLDTRVDGPWSFGEPKEQGKRSDLEAVREAIDDGMGVRELQDNFFSQCARYGKFFHEYKRVHMAARSFKTVVILFVGPPGIGKTRSAFSLLKSLGSFYVVPRPKGSGLYFDGYDHQDSMFIDEMDGNMMTPNMFNTLADRYECVVPIHGSAGHQFTSKYLVICSNYLPKYWWKKRSDVQVEQTTRRIDVLIPLLRLKSSARKVYVPFHFEVINKN